VLTSVKNKTMIGVTADSSKSKEARADRRDVLIVLDDNPIDLVRKMHNEIMERCVCPVSSFNSERD
jgi:hypothetical protein